KTIVTLMNVPEWWFYARPAQVEGVLRVCQLLAILALTFLFLFYSIPFGKNLRGILLGYGFFVSWSVLCLALVAAGVAKADSFWSYTYPISYVLSVVVWTVHLWSYQPNPIPDRAIPLEQEYQRAVTWQRRSARDQYYSRDFDLLRGDVVARSAGDARLFGETRARVSHRRP